MERARERGLVEDHDAQERSGLGQAGVEPDGLFGVGVVGVEEEELRARQFLGEGEARKIDVAELVLPEAGLDVVVAECEPKGRVWRSCAYGASSWAAYREGLPSG
jgi:hypothetical protein